MPKTQDERLQNLFKAATAHAEETCEPDMECGDLIEIIQSCWEHLTNDQKEAVLKSSEENLANYIEEE